eukprot:3068235-Rhodomonas_salina.3
MRDERARSEREEEPSAYVWRAPPPVAVAEGLRGIKERGQATVHRQSWGAGQGGRASVGW